MKIVVRGLYGSIYQRELIEAVFDPLHRYDFELNLAYLNRLWLYILGSLLLAIAYIIHRREDH